MGLELRRARNGRGVFTTRMIPKGRKVLAFEGPKITAAQYRRLSRFGQSHSMRFWAKEAYCRISGINAYVNHSCDPNTGLRTARSLFALRDIKAGEEITFDYSTSLVLDIKLRCNCGSRYCRGVARGFYQLDRPTQLRYIRMKVVPKWIISYGSKHR